MGVTVRHQPDHEAEPSPGETGTCLPINAPWEHRLIDRLRY